MGSDVALRICGALDVTVDGAALRAADVGSRKARTLLRLLAARHPDTLTGGQIASALWSGATPADPDAVIASLVSRLRGTLGADAIVGGRGGYRLGAVTVDVHRARELVVEAERRDGPEPTLAAAAARAALQILGRGLPLPEEAQASWADELRAEVDAVRRRARTVLAGAALAIGDPAGAADAARQALADDPLDETAARHLMSALLAQNETGAALAVYEQVRRRLSDELGADPAPATRAIHLAVLRGTGPASPTAARRPGALAAAADDRLPLAGRAEEVALLGAAWTDAVERRGRTVLVLGEAGCGKTRLIDAVRDLAGRTGAVVLAARCYEAERSLFAQPVVDAVADGVGRLPADTVVRACTGHEDALVRLIPGLATVLAAARPDVEALDPGTNLHALIGVIRGLAAAAPVLVVLDDVQHAGRSTLDVLHRLTRLVRGEAVLIVAALREDEGRDAVSQLGPLASIVSLGPLSAGAVTQLAAQAGQERRSGEILRRTGGNALFVVETLRALAKDDDAIPETVHAAVLDRVHRAGASVESVLRGGAVLGAAFDPVLCARLVELPQPTTLQACEDALSARLLTTVGPLFEFAHDTVRDVLLASMPSPSRHALHRRAADLLVDRPEAVAGHAEAIGDVTRAARAWLLAAEQAAERYAAADAVTLAGRAVRLAEELGDAELVGRILLVRGRALYVRAEYARALHDFEQAGRAARVSGDQRLEMAVLRELAGDVPVALGRPPAALDDPLRSCLALAEGLGDNATAADVLDRLTVLSCTRLDFSAAAVLARRAHGAGIAAQDVRALVRGLDARKTAAAYRGDVTELATVIEELEPLLRTHRELWLLQWAVFDSAWVPLAAGDFDAASERIGEAVEICRRSGYTAYESYFLAHHGWVLRLRGDLGAAVRVGRQAHELGAGRPHMWWTSTAAGLLGSALLDAGQPDEARTVLERAERMTDVAGAQAYRLRCVAALARATGSPDLRATGERLLHSITGSAWLTGADAYTDLARAAKAADEPDRAAALLAPLRAAATAAGWPVLVEACDRVDA